MLRLLNDTDTADVTLLCQNDDGQTTKIKVHACILASRSEYYRTLFSNAFKENKTDEFVLPPELNQTRARLLLEFMYADKWDIESDHARDLCQTMVPIADCFAVLDLKQLCERA